MALDFMRRHRRWLFIFLWLVIGAFIILYIPAFTGHEAGSPAEALGQVGDLPITRGEFQKAYVRQRQRLERLYQGRLDEAAFRSLGLEEQVFESLVSERLVALEARRLGLAVDDKTLAASVTTSPDLVENGRFIGVEELKRRLALQGVSVQEFEESFRRQLLAERLQDLVTDGVSVSPEEADREFRRRTEQVKAEYVLVEAARFRGQLAVSEDEAKARFEAMKDAYRIPERRVVSYVLLDAEALRSRVTVTDADILAYYDEHKDEFKEEEQVCASHILVKAKSAPEAKEGRDEAEAKRIAEGLLVQVKAGGDFAALAKKVSEDKGSADRGGDLSCFPRGRMVPDFDNAAFSLGTGETSDLVKTPFGYHIIRVTSRREETVPPLTLVKERIRQTLLAERVQVFIEGKVDAISEPLRRGKTLEDVAKEHGLTVQKSAPMARGEGVAPLASPVLASKAFELKVGEIDKEAFPLPRGYAFIALAEIQKEHVPELKEVQEKVKADILEERARERARVQALEVKARAEKAGLEKAAAALDLVRKETPSLVGRGQPLADLGSSAALDESVFALPDKALSDPLPAAEGYAVVRVLEKKAFDPAAFEQQRASITASLREQKRSQLFQAYLAALHQRFPVERRPDAFRRVVG